MASRSIITMVSKIKLCHCVLWIPACTTSYQVFSRVASLSSIAPLAGYKSYTGEDRASSTEPPEGAGGQSSDPMLHVYYPSLTFGSLRVKYYKSIQLASSLQVQNTYFFITSSITFKNIYTARVRPARDNSNFWQRCRLVANLRLQTTWLGTPGSRK